MLRDANTALDIAFQFHRVARLLDVVSEGGGLCNVSRASNYVQALEFALRALLLAAGKAAPRGSDLSAFFLQLDRSLQSQIHFELSRSGHGDMFTDSDALAMDLEKVSQALAQMLSLHAHGMPTVDVALLQSLTALVIKIARHELAPTL